MRNEKDVRERIHWFQGELNRAVLNPHTSTDYIARLYVQIAECCWVLGIDLSNLLGTGAE